MPKTAILAEARVLMDAGKTAQDAAQAIAAMHELDADEVLSLIECEAVA
jgi:hypothetical protein